MFLLQRFDLGQCLACTGQRPSLGKFVLVTGAPVLDVYQRSPGKLTVNQTRNDLDGQLLFTLQRMKLGRRVVATINLHHDPDEAADLRHRAV